MLKKQKQKRDYFLNLDGMDGMRISNVTYCKLNKRLKTLHFFERKKKISKLIKGGVGGWNKNFPGRKISKN